MNNVVKSFYDNVFKRMNSLLALACLFLDGVVFVSHEFLLYVFYARIHVSLCKNAMAVKHKNVICILYVRVYIQTRHNTQKYKMKHHVYIHV